MDKLAAALGNLFNRIAEFFDIFDLSFFVSGGLCLTAIGVWLHEKHPARWEQLSAVVSHPVGAILLVLATYVAGLVAFAWGRAFRVVLFDTGRWVHRTFSQARQSRAERLERARNLDHPASLLPRQLEVDGPVPSRPKKGRWRQGDRSRYQSWRARSSIMKVGAWYLERELRGGQNGLRPSALRVGEIVPARRPAEEVRQETRGQRRTASQGPRAAGRVESEFETILQAHGLRSEPIVSGYLNREDYEDQGVWRLYVRMWAKLRETKTLASSYTLVKRYWVMAAVYDGIAFSALVWLATIATILGKQTPYGILPVVLVVLAGAYRESQRLSASQMEEMVAALALLNKKERLIWVPPPPGTDLQVKPTVDEKEEAPSPKELPQEKPKKPGEGLQVPTKLPKDIEG